MKKLSHLKYEEVKNYSVEELLLIRIKAIDELTHTEVCFNNTHDDGRRRGIKTTIEHYRRVLSMVNGIIKAKNRIDNDKQANGKIKLRAAKERITDLEKQI